jgi:hypothetical protein
VVNEPNTHTAILSGLPSYGYDWRADYSDTPLFWADTDALVKQSGATPRYDGATHSVTFRYTPGACSGTRIVFRARGTLRWPRSRQACRIAPGMGLRRFVTKRAAARDAPAQIRKITDYCSFMRIPMKNQ